MLPIPLFRARLLAISAALIATALAIGLTQASKITIDYGSFHGFYFIVVSLAAIAVYCYCRGMSRIGECLDVVALVIFLLIPTLVSTYLSVGIAMPLAGPYLAAMDAALGFHWVAYISFIDSHPMLAALLDHAYQTLGYQLIAIPLILAVARKSDRAYAMAFGFVLVCFISSLIAVWYPARDAYSFYGLDHSTLSNIDPYSAYSYLGDFYALRNNPQFTLGASSASGLLTFPSVHAGLACLYTWAAWELKLIRYPILALNVAMTVSAISHGGHYLVDVIAGLGVAAFAIAVTTAAFYRNFRPERSILHRARRTMAGNHGHAQLIASR